MKQARPHVFRCSAVAPRSARGDRGIRMVADEIGVSAATLSRVERGLMPDLETFGKICRWLKVDPAEVLGVTDVVHKKRPAVAVHFRRITPCIRRQHKPSLN